MGIKENDVEAHGVQTNTNESSVEDRPAEPQKLASNTNEDGLEDTGGA